MRSRERAMVPVYSLPHTQRENTPPVWFSNSDFPLFLRRGDLSVCLFLSPRWAVYFVFLCVCVCVFLADLPGAFAFFFVLSVDANYQLGIIIEVCEGRTALASIHARSTPGYLLWNCDPSRDTAHVFPISTFPKCFHVRTGYFRGYLWVKCSECRGVLPAVSDATSHTDCMRNTCVEGRELADTNLLPIHKASTYL